MRVTVRFPVDTRPVGRSEAKAGLHALVGFRVKGSAITAAAVTPKVNKQSRT